MNRGLNRLKQKSKQLYVRDSARFQVKLGGMIVLCMYFPDQGMVIRPQKEYSIPHILIWLISGMYT